jgi:hypothetical protein
LPPRARSDTGFESIVSIPLGHRLVKCSGIRYLTKIKWSFRSKDRSLLWEVTIVRIVKRIINKVPRKHLDTAGWFLGLLGQVSSSNSSEMLMRESGWILDIEQRRIVIVPSVSRVWV